MEEGKAGVPKQENWEQSFQQLQVFIDEQTTNQTLKFQDVLNAIEEMRSMMCFLTQNNPKVVNHQEDDSGVASAAQHLRINSLGIELPKFDGDYATGLKTKILRELLISKPASLMDAFELVQVFESRYFEFPQVTRAQNKWSPKNFSSVVIQHTMGGNNSSPMMSRPTSFATLVKAEDANKGTHRMNRRLSVKMLTPAEMQDRRARGLCYNCDQKWVTGHRCMP
ncbi:hypothetical protein C2S53_001984 [Perilla frutescens var. hirtella]|uniref:Uncharacterized protein n=1 Tax=Perilla frutescens var. hirtella TaxID=608512 RepID=A0AAD4JPY4_PERFH|nr:hypothetical protein C2S53_001984 [Perilla frutescens var. hirtella]